MSDQQLAKKRPKVRRWFGRSLLVFVILIKLAVSGFVFWALNPTLELPPEVNEALRSDDAVTVTTRGWIAFVPNEVLPEAGIILYPGGRVPAAAYAPYARQLAQQGYLAVIPYAPLNLAILNPNMADAIIENFSGIEQWVIGGHSLGGATAAIYAENTPEQIDGLVFIASRPANGDLLDNDLAILSIYGTQDGVQTAEELQESYALLPPDATYAAIEGGNHAQFGYYGAQAGDQPATISHDEQLTQTVDAILALLDAITEANP